jgi:hypothetical protein
VRKIMLALLAAGIVLASAPAPVDAAAASQSWVNKRVAALKAEDKRLRKQLRDMGGAPRGDADWQDVEATQEGDFGECTPLVEFLDGDAALCIGFDEHVGDPDTPTDNYGSHIFLWLETTVPLQRVTSTAEPLEPVLGCDEVIGNCLGDPDFSRFILLFVNNREVAGGAYRGDPKFISADGDLIEIRSQLLLCLPERGCFARASVRETP